MTAAHRCLRPNNKPPSSATSTTPDELINRYISASKKRLIALLEEQRQAVIHQAVTNGLAPDVQTKPGEIPWLENVPKHWIYDGSAS